MLELFELHSGPCFTEVGRALILPMTSLLGTKVSWNEFEGRWKS